MYIVLSKDQQQQQQLHASSCARQLHEFEYLDRVLVQPISVFTVLCDSHLPVVNRSGLVLDDDHERVQRFLDMWPVRLLLVLLMRLLLLLLLLLLMVSSLSRTLLFRTSTDRSTPTTATTACPVADSETATSASTASAATSTTATTTTTTTSATTASASNALCTTETVRQLLRQINTTHRLATRTKTMVPDAVVMAHADILPDTGSPRCY
uniref:Uncharacterized protein n=1 Tax=Anopheles farauti TaxID=69004 RepID=A0A182QDK3_9DIPT